MAKLVCQAGNKAGHEYRLDQERTVFGRLSQCDVVINDPKASREHFAIHRYGPLYALHDLKSRNGTRVNEHRVRERLLGFGDRIRVGACEYLLVQEENDRDLADLLTKYELEEKIGEGGMGIVYRARQRSMDRQVALKILSPRHAQKKRFIDQFIEEARAAGSLNHPNIIQVHDVGTENDIHYFSMEYIDGPTAAQLLKRNGPLAVAVALEIARQTAKALEYAHAQKIIHRDIKPDNIMITSDEVVKLADLGISKSIEELDQGNERSVVGTPHYLAPEAARGDKIDYRLDLYSLGASLFHLLTDQTPFNSANATEIIHAHIHDPPPDLRPLNLNVPEAVCSLCERLMAKDPAARPASATALIAEIEELQNSLGLSRQQTNSETLLLRRFATNDNSATPASPDDDVAPSTATLSETLTRIPRLVPGILIAVFIVIALLIVMSLLTDSSQEPATTPTHPPPERAAAIDPPATSDIETDDPDTASPDQSEPQRISKELAEIEGLRTTIDAASDLAALAEANRSLDAIQSRDLTSEAREQIAALKTRVTTRIASQRKTEAWTQFSKLRDKIYELERARDYDQAISLVDGFVARHGDDSPESAQTIRSDLVRSRQRFIDGLMRQISLLTNKGDHASLRELRDNLPPSLGSSTIVEAINTALKQLNQQRLDEQAAVLDDIRNDLATWHLHEIESAARAQREDFGDTPNGERFDAYRAMAGELMDLISEIDRAVRPQKRYQGQLQYLDSPHLIGADIRGIIAKLGSAEVTVSWPKLQRGELLQIIETALPQRLAHYTATLENYDALIATENEGADTE